MWSGAALFRAGVFRCMQFSEAFFRSTHCMCLYDGCMGVAGIVGVCAYRRTANDCSSWTQFLAVGGVFVGYLGIATVLQRSATMISGPTVGNLVLCVFQCMPWPGQVQASSRVRRVASPRHQQLCRFPRLVHGPELSMAAALFRCFAVRDLGCGKRGGKRDLAR